MKKHRSVKNNLFVAIATFAVCMASNIVQASSLIGQTITEQYYAYGSVYNQMSGSSGSFVAGSSTFSFPGYYVLSANATQIIFNFTSSGTWSPSPVSYNAGGLYIKNGVLLDIGQAISSVTLDGATNMAGLTAAHVTYGGSHIALDWANLSFQSEVTTVILNVNTTVNTNTNTGYRKPTANRPDGGGDRNGYEFYPTNAYVADGVSAEDIDSGSDLGASCISACKDKHKFYNFGFNIPTASHITGLEVRLKANADSASGSPRIFAQVSWDGGISWTARKKTKVLGTVLTNYRMGTSTDTWGHAWNANDFSDYKFRVRLINVSGDITSDFSLDSVDVRVSYY